MCANVRKACFDPTAFFMALTEVRLGCTIKKERDALLARVSLKRSLPVIRHLGEGVSALNEKWLNGCYSIQDDVQCAHD